MIVDNLKNLGLYISLHKDFKEVKEYIERHKLEEMECRRYEIKGEDVFLNLEEYETKDEQKLEAHKKYIDIQVVVEGEEYMGYSGIENTEIVEEYREEKDVMFLRGNVDKVKADNKNFVIFYPQDAHMPGLSVEGKKRVKKAIFKIKK